MLDLVGYSRVIVAWSGLTERIVLPLASSVLFETPTARLYNVDGYITDKAGHGASLQGSTLDFGNPVSMQFDLVFPIVTSTPIMRLNLVSIGASMAIIENGKINRPNGIQVEEPNEQLLRFGGSGALVFISGFLAGGGRNRKTT
jgi:hypothetical protein